MKRIEQQAICLYIFSARRPLTYRRSWEWVDVGDVRYCGYRGPLQGVVLLQFGFSRMSCNNTEDCNNSLLHVNAYKYRLLKMCPWPDWPSAPLTSGRVMNSFSLLSGLLAFIFSCTLSWRKLDLFFTKF